MYRKNDAHQINECTCWMLDAHFVLQFVAAKTTYVNGGYRMQSAVALGSQIHASEKLHIPFFHTDQQQQGLCKNIMRKMVPEQQQEPVLTK